MTDGQLLEGYVARRDGAAFEAVVRRYGPLVYRVCRDVLNDPNDAEDAFQATFLVLVRRAESIRDGDALGRWLYETASRIAIRAKVSSRRRLERETQGVDMVASGTEHELERRDLRPVVHAELNRLPESLRAPLVLCYLEGRSYEDAARRLRLPLGTLKGRLVKGRELLRHRLTRRGVTASAFLLLVLLTEEAPAVPITLIESTVHSGALVAAQPVLPATIPDRVSELVQAELRQRAATTLGRVGIVLAASALIVLSVARVAPAVSEPSIEWAQSILLHATHAEAAASCHASTPEPELPIDGPSS